MSIIKVCIGIELLRFSVLIRRHPVNTFHHKVSWFHTLHSHICDVFHPLVAVWSSIQCSRLGCRFFERFSHTWKPPRLQAYVGCSGWSYSTWELVETCQRTVVPLPMLRMPSQQLIVVRTLHNHATNGASVDKWDLLLHWNHPQVLDLGPRQGIAPNYLASRRITDDKSRLCDDVPDLDIEIVTVDQLACLHVDSDQFASLVFTHIQRSSHYGYLYLSPAQCLVGLIGFLADFNACSLMLLNA